MTKIVALPISEKHMELNQLIGTMPVDPMYTANELVRLAFEVNKIKTTGAILMSGKLLYNKLLLVEGMTAYYVDLFVGHWGNFALYLHALFLSLDLWNDRGELKYELHSINSERLVLSELVPFDPYDRAVQSPILPCY